MLCQIYISMGYPDSYITRRALAGRVLLEGWSRRLEWNVAAVRGFWCLHVRKGESEADLQKQLAEPWSWRRCNPSGPLDSERVTGLETALRTVWTVLHSWGDAWRSWHLRAVSSPELKPESFIERDLDALEVHQNVLPKSLTTLTYPEPSRGIGSLMRRTLCALAAAVGTLCSLLMIHTASTCASWGRSANAFLPFSASLQMLFKGPWPFAS